MFKQIKNHLPCHFTPTRQIITSVGDEKLVVRRNVEKLELSYTAGQECKNCAATLENSLAILQKVEHRVTIIPSNSTPRYLPKRNENICNEMK